jgi:hypothetical protein
MLISMVRIRVYEVALCHKARKDEFDPLVVDR